MGNGLKIFAALGAVAAGAAAIFALKKRKELQDYDYEELDDDFDDCCCDCDECAAEEATDDSEAADDTAAPEVTDDTEADLDNIEDAVEEVDK
ncbi:hypothetical protein [Ruminococcus sp. Marseille-P6503]|uniref:hypothetical protein n=1 Tax=Ruminococcus sp. Marseille-P6503 TaxID=2364796 RepID=UPI0019D1387A|nr:hypothetical protein [Ruminococcus sp. Marseille-P6503]